jgi:hypothetical protein
MPWNELIPSRLRSTPRFVWILLGLGLALGVVFAFHGTGSMVGQVKPEQRTFDHLHEAGRVVVGVQSVAAFEDYIDSLQPKFQLTPEVAYQEAIAQTQVREIEEVRELLLKMMVQFPQRPAEAVSGEKDSATGTGSETRKESSPAAPSPVIREDLARALATLEAGNRPLNTDPALRYRAAAALLQEVALLSSYVKDAAVSADTIPYVVRQLITVFPSARREPYDIYTTIAYFGGKANTFSGAFAQALENASNERKALSLPGEMTCSGSKVEVVPLFVTDNLETSWLSSNRVAARGLDASGSGGSTLLGAELAAKSQQETGVRNLSRDLNSLFTVGRVAENAVEVRLGAASIDGTYQLVPRTFNLTSLVLVPRVSDKDTDFVVQHLGSQVAEAERTSLEVSVRRSALDALPCKTVRYTAHTEMRHADTGSVLPPPNFADLVNDVEQDITALPPAFVQSKDGDAAVNSARLVEAALSGDFETFQSQSGLREAAIPLIWARLSRLLATSGYASGSFPIYRPKVVFFNPDHQIWDAVNERWIRMAAPALVDDGKVTRLRLSGAQGLSGKALTGYLAFTPAQTKDEAQVTLTATAIKMEDEGRSAVIEFPSLKGIMRPGTTVNVGLSYQRNLYRWSDPVDRFSDWYRSGLLVLDVRPI